MSDFICQKYTDCSSCSHYQKQIFKYRSFPKGMMIPKERCSQNTIYFLISGRQLRVGVMEPWDSLASFRLPE